MKQWIKGIKRNFEWMSAFTGPFKRPRLKLYVGKIALGTPYFFPRRWRNLTKDEARESADEKFKRLVDAGKEPSRRIWDGFYKSSLRSQKTVPKKIGFDFVPMRWKTKWSDTDYRFETGPIWSFVFFKWQIGLTFPVEEMSHYWECWLYYTYSTDKTKSVKERIQEARKGFPCVWTTSRGENEETICYWDVILKKEYL